MMKKKKMMIGGILFSVCVNCFAISSMLEASSAKLVGHSWTSSSLYFICRNKLSTYILLSTMSECSFSSKANDRLTLPTFGFGLISGRYFDGYTPGVIIIGNISLDPLTPVAVVWSAKGYYQLPFDDISLEFKADGNLVFKDLAGSQVLWSTNTSGRSMRSMNLTCEGNLILVDHKDGVVWQSFDHPTDTWLFGQTLPIGTVMTSRATSDDYFPGLYQIKVAEDGFTALAAQIDPPVGYLSYSYDSFDTVDFKVSPLGISIDATNFTYLRLEPDGHLYQFGYPHQLTDNVSETLVADLFSQDICLYPTTCGNYGICYGPNNCNCPQNEDDSSYYFKPVDASSLHQGCTRVTPLSPCSHSHTTTSQTFLKQVNVTYFGFDSYWNLTAVDAQTCKTKCLQNCSCVAAIFKYSSENISSGYCSLPSEILTLRYANNDSMDYITFIKVQRRNTPTNKLLPKVVASVSASLLLLIILSAGAWYYAASKRRKTDKYPSDLVIDTVMRFSFETLRVATKDFDKRLGRGGFGSVFEGTLPDGKKVAVKRLESVGQGRKEFLAEVNTIGTIHHFNLVKLVGFCDEGLHRLLVYEYMVNGSLDKWIFNLDMAHTLTWSLRQKIIFGIARGLEYLHENCNPNVIHFDIKPQNILLDADFNVKISDFGLAKLVERDEAQVMTLIRGTPGYIAPELIAGRAISVKVDVYSFGVLALEIVCGRKNVSPPGEELLTNLVKVKADEDRLSDMVDERTEDMQLQKEEAVKMMKIGIWCLQPHFIRPTMSTVVKVLQDHPNMETLGDLSYLTIVHEAIPGDVNPTYSTCPTESLLSGPR